RRAPFEMVNERARRELPRLLARKPPSILVEDDLRGVLIRHRCFEREAVRVRRDAENASVAATGIAWYERAACELARDDARAPCGHEVVDVEEHARDRWS